MSPVHMIPDPDRWLDLHDPASVERLAAALPAGAAYLYRGTVPVSNEEARLWVAAAIIAELRKGER